MRSRGTTGTAGCCWWASGSSRSAIPPAPGLLKFQWARTTNTYFREVQSQVAATGVWYRFAFALQGKGASGWQGDSEEAFGYALEDVGEIRITVETTPSPGQTAMYRVDDVYVDYLPRAVAAQGDATNAQWVTWDYLQTNAFYQFQSAESVDAAWSNAAAWTATGRQHTVGFTNPATAGFYRLLIP